MTSYMIDLTWLRLFYIITYTKIDFCLIIYYLIFFLTSSYLRAEQKKKVLRFFIWANYTIRYKTFKIVIKRLI